MHGEPFTFGFFLVGVIGASLAGYTRNTLVASVTNSILLFGFAIYASQ